MEKINDLENLLWYAKEATCHPDPNYYYEFQRLATPGVIVDIIESLKMVEQSIAELESRTVKLPKKNIGWDRDEDDCWNNAIDACTEALTAAGIKVG